MSIESLSSNQPSAAESDIAAFKEAKIRARQEREAAERIANKEALLESIFADSPAGDTEEDARRFAEGSEYLAHLEKLANRPKDFDPLDDEYDREYTAAVAENESFDLYKAEAISQVKEQISADPKLRRIEMLADSVAALRQTEVPADADAEKRLSTVLESKEEKFAELIADYDTESSLPADEKLLLTNYLMDRAMIGEAATPVVTYKDFTANKPEAAPVTSSHAAKTKDSEAFIDTENLKVLAAMDKPDVSVDRNGADNSADQSDAALDSDDQKVLSAMDKPDVSVDRNGADNTQDSEAPLDTDDLRVLAAMDKPDVSVDKSADDSSYLNFEELQAEAAQEQEQANREAVEEEHRRNRFNPMYRLPMAFGAFRDKIREKTRKGDGNERKKGSYKVLGAAAVGAVALAAIFTASKNPDFAEDIRNWADELGKNLGFAPEEVAPAPENNGGNGSLDTTPDVIPEPDTTPDHTPVPAPVESELMNAPAFNIPEGGGGINMLRDLGVETPTLATWDSISADLPELFPTEFYREFEPSGHVDIRISDDGPLSEEARKILLQRLGK